MYTKARVAELVDAVDSKLIAKRVIRFDILQVIER